MTGNYPQKKPIPPLNSSGLRSLALFYVGKYATTRKKLNQYLSRKLRERGWEDSDAPNIEALVEEFTERGYIDDAVFAATKARSLVSRGYGLKRLEQDIYANGIEGGDTSEALSILQENQWQAADNFARKKRIGPYAKEEASREQKQKQLGAFLRAGHDMKVAQKFLNADIDDVIDEVMDDYADWEE